MSVRSCRVTIQDLEGVAHTVGVTAESLFEAVAQGLAALRGKDWVMGFQEGIVKVSVADVRVEHAVKLADFTRWLERPNRSPRDTWHANHAIKNSLSVAWDSETPIAEDAPDRCFPCPVTPSMCFGFLR